MTSLSIERRKSPRAWVLMTVALALIGLNIANGTGNYLAHRAEFTQQGITWLAVWGQAALLWGALFFPFLITMRAASLTRMEHEQGNWQRLASYGAAVRVAYRGKIILMTGFALLCQVLFLAAVLVVSLALGFPLSAADVGMMVLWSLLGALGGTSIAMIQIVVGIIVRSFATTVVIGLGASVLSLAITVVVPVLGVIYPYSQVLIGMQARSLSMPSPLALVGFMLVNTLFILTAWLIGRGVLKRKEH